MISWSNTGYLDALTTGLYAFTDVVGSPSGYDGEYGGLIIHPDLPRRIYVSQLDGHKGLLQLKPSSSRWTA